ncbi:MAG: Lrp/AsnC family transcriptional regulator [Prevotella sp.]|nr:Lrp/AsnC family transcriptional regulator [Bacteroides sp.]MCM1365735.1 Lrp/AsnC family transcriptional regulator [Prevotella sp.]MCM1436405.1 Lrp/AsnC family transcriptional regulator [Prevotella sp.]
MANLDSTDIKILQILQRNSQMTMKELASEVNLSTTPVYERVKRLEKCGVIKGYVAILNPDKLNLGFSVYCNVKLESHRTDAAIEFMDIIKEIPEVTECYSMAGAFDYLLKIYAPNMAYYKEFVIGVLGQIKAIGSVTSTFVMSEVKRTSALPLNL